MMAAACPAGRFVVAHVSLVMVLFALTVRAQAESRADDPPTVAVLRLAGSGLSDADLRLLTDRLRIELFQAGRFHIVERERVDEILAEQEFQVSACATTKCAVELGQLLGVGWMVVGGVGRIEGMYTLNTRLVNVETGAVARVAARDCECSLRDVVRTEVRQVARQLSGLSVSAERVGEPNQHVSGEVGRTTRAPSRAAVSRQLPPEEAGRFDQVAVGREISGVTLHGGRSWARKPYETLAGNAFEFGFVYLGQSGWGGGMQFAVHGFSSGWGGSFDALVRYGYRPFFVQGLVGGHLYERGDEFAYPDDPDYESLGGVSVGVGGGVYLNRYIGIYGQYRSSSGLRITSVGITVLGAMIGGE